MSEPAGWRKVTWTCRISGTSQHSCSGRPSFPNPHCSSLGHITCCEASCSCPRGPWLVLRTHPHSPQRDGCISSCRSWTTSCSLLFVHHFPSLVHQMPHWNLKLTVTVPPNHPQPSKPCLAHSSEPPPTATPVPSSPVFLLRDSTLHGEDPPSICFLLSLSSRPSQLPTPRAIP